MPLDVLNHMMVILLVVICVLVIFAKIRLPSALGYLTAGVLVGPEVLGILSTQKETAFLSEVGIILMMFMIGLEFSWPKLKRNFRMIVGVGFTTVAIITTALTLVLTHVFGLSLGMAFLISGAMAISSTAVVGKQMMDQKELYDSHGRIAFGVTLFEDFAALIFLAAIPALAPVGESKGLVYDLSAVLFTTFAVFIGLYFVGQKIERPLMRFIGTLKSNEIFILTTLLIIAGAVWVSDFFHLSATIGAFLAGTIIGETEFKYKIEEDIRPFRDIMVGVFFIVMGLTLNFSALVSSFPMIIAILAAVVIIKFTLITFIVSVYKSDLASGLRVGIILSNCGEFSLMLIMLSMHQGIIPAEVGNVMLLVSVASLILSTLFISYNQKIAFFLLSVIGHKKKAKAEAPEEAHDNKDLINHIILCGFGETGKNFCKIIEKVNIPVLAIDMDPQRMEDAADMGCRAVYGDATNMKILNAANIEKARALVLTFDNYAHALKLLHKVRSEYRHLPIIARVHHHHHIEDLMMMGATTVFSDGLGTSLSMREEIMKTLKIPEFMLPEEGKLAKEFFSS